MGVPRIIHQIWWQGESQIPPKYQHYRDVVDQFLEANAQYQYMFWDESSCIDVVRELFPSALWLFGDASPAKLVEKCDMARLAILFKYGGVYLDLDYLINPNFDTLVQRYDTTPTHHRTSFLQETFGVTNCIIFSTPANPVMEMLFDECVHRFRHPPLVAMLTRDLKTMDTTGPYMVSKAMHLQKFRDNVKNIPEYEARQFGYHAGEGEWTSGKSTTRNTVVRGKSVFDHAADAGNAVSKLYVESVRHEWFLPGMLALSLTTALVAPSFWIGVLVLVLVLYVDVRMFTSTTNRSTYDHLGSYLVIAVGAGAGIAIRHLCK